MISAINSINSGMGRRWRRFASTSPRVPRVPPTIATCAWCAQGFSLLRQEEAPAPSLGFAERLVRQLGEMSRVPSMADFFERVGRRFVYATLALTLLALLALALPSTGPVRSSERFRHSGAGAGGCRWRIPIPWARAGSRRNRLTVLRRMPPRRPFRMRRNDPACLSVFHFDHNTGGRAGRCGCLLFPVAHRDAFSTPAGSTKLAPKPILKRN